MTEAVSNSQISTEYLLANLEEMDGVTNEFKADINHGVGFKLIQYLIIHPNRQDSDTFESVLFEYVLEQLQPTPIGRNRDSIKNTVNADDLYMVSLFKAMGFKAIKTIDRDESNESYVMQLKQSQFRQFRALADKLRA